MSLHGTLVRGLRLVLDDCESLMMLRTALFGLAIIRQILRWFVL
jgi:hypothetical protein